MASCRGSNRNEMMRLWLKKNKRRMRNKKTTKRKRKRISYQQHTIGSSIVDDDVVVCQILSRLPVKSLMRFKCVCKSWKSIMEEDSHFMNLHLGHSETRPSLFILLQKSADYLERCKSFLSANLYFNGRDANIHTLSKEHSISYRKILGPIGGLICFVDIFAVRIYNVSTREVTPWIKSTVFMNVENENGIADALDGSPHCNFGFDPTTKKHKVIFMWCEGKFQDFPVCEVLTVGDNTWRVIGELPPCLNIGMATVSVNGSIYWNLFGPFGDDIGIKLRLDSSDSEDAESPDEEEDYTEWIMAFDIESEKFRMFPVPPVPKYERDESFSFNEFSLSVVDGCLAILRQTDRKVKMWIFQDHNKENGISITSSEKDWTRLSIKLTIELRRSAIYVHSVSGRDQIILETYRDAYYHGKRNARDANFYYYDRKNNTLRKLEINGITSIPEDCRAECSTFVENLLPVRKKV
ncbi:hypothetical protein MKW92_002440 [Papaver armeniacum]|nr:hypothetical protein MKW92_002440 [Papaver armeniacum]